MFFPLQGKSTAIKWNYSSYKRIEIMSTIYKTRRKVTVERYQTTDYKTVKNPFYNEKEMKEHILAGFQYNIVEYYEKEVPVTVTNRTAHIEYLIKCEHCGSKGWVKRKDAKYCTASCRKLAYLERKKAKEKEANHDTNEIQ